MARQRAPCLARAICSGLLAAVAANTFVLKSVNLWVDCPRVNTHLPKGNKVS